MSKTTFPDVIGPTTVAANGGTPVRIRQKHLNVESAGVTADDEPARRRTNLRLPDETWSVASASVGSSGEWLPADTAFGPADMIRVNASTSGVLLTGFDSTADPIRLVKFVANTGSNTISLQPPASPIAGKQYFLGTPFALGVGVTARVVWDAVTRVYRLRGAVAEDYIVLDGDHIDLDGDDILNPN